MTAPSRCVIHRSWDMSRRHLLDTCKGKGGYGDERSDFELIFKRTDLNLRNKCIGVGNRRISWHGLREDRPRQFPGQASGGVLPGCHVRWLGESGQRLRGWTRSGQGFPWHSTSVS
ncbi:hypothetical protein TNCV_5017421 [Trichonephila clavipes]|nr:hypothetical protein TNCV_5017421 [Trichonephila clavipes]